MITGIGGGYDIYAGLPLFYELRKNKHQTIHLASYSLSTLHSDDRVAIPNVLNVVGENKHDHYAPEEWLGNYLREEDGYGLGVWQIGRLGVKRVNEAYKFLIEGLGIDLILMVDGGFDSLMHGDEAGPGTLLEDSISLAALDDFNTVKKYLACVGFGTEIEERLCHHHVLENIAELAREGHYYGGCALTSSMPAFQYYASIYEWIRLKEGFKESHIASRIIPAVRGEFGGKDFLNPLMGIYWFFEGQAVIAKNKLICKIRNTNLHSDVMLLYRQLLANGFVSRKSEKMPDFV